MKDTARIITTLRCGRGCAYCPNNQYAQHARGLIDLRQLLDYNSVCLTGGEPLLEPVLFQALVRDLRNIKDFKVYLYASNFITLDDLLGAIEETDGITWTMHKGANAFDSIRLGIVQHNLDPKKHNRLVLHTDAHADWQRVVEFHKWERVTVLYMTSSTCQLPSNEDLYILKEAYD